MKGIHMTERKTECAAQLQSARATLDGLTQREADISGRLEKIGAKRKSIAFAANTSGGKAKADLRDLHRETMTLQVEREDLSVAIAEARSRLATAEAAVANCAVIETAQAGIAHATSAADRAARIKAHLKGAVSEMQAYFEDIEAARRAGAEFPGRDIVHVILQEGWNLEFIPLRARPARFEVPVNASHRAKREIESALRHYAESALRSLEAIRARANGAAVEQAKAA
jgi:hypothetical protein